MKKTALCITLIAIFLAYFSLGLKTSDDDYIKWVDFNVPYTIMHSAYKYDIESHDKEVHLKMHELLAYLAARNGNQFNIRRDTKSLSSLVSKLREGAKIEDLIEGNKKYFNYYLQAYSAIFAGFLGNYVTDDSQNNYGLIAYHPLAQGYGYGDYDDFGNSRNYGFKRLHLGHDIFGSTGTPIIAAENGTISEFGWNKYGGWRVGLRTTDGKRFYYYAHLRKNRPYAEGLKKGSKIQAGQVIGYMGSTGYSNKENQNMRVNPHLHFGLQLIFHESQVKGRNEIWIDVYNICKLLRLNRAKTQRDTETKEYKSVNLRRSMPQKKSALEFQENKGLQFKKTNAV